MLFSMVLLYQSRPVLSSVFLVFFAEDLASLSEDLTTLFGLFQVGAKREEETEAAELIAAAAGEVLIGELFVSHGLIVSEPTSLVKRFFGFFCG